MPRPEDTADVEYGELFRLLVQNSNDIITVTDENGLRRFVAGPTLRILGYTPEELVGTSPFAMIHPDDEPLVRTALREGAAVPGASRSVAYRWRHRDGHIVHLEAVGTNLLHDPRVRGVVLNVRDVSERHEAERQLEESEARYRTIVESSPMGIHSYVLDERGLVLVGANPAADRILGIDHRPLLGRTIHEAFPALAGSDAPARYREVIERGTPWTTSQIDYEDGRVRGAYEVYAFRTSPGRMAAIFLDVAGRLKAEEERRQLEDQLAQAQRLESIGRLAGGVAHEFNNLLTGITGSIGLAMMDVPPDAPLHETLADVRRAADGAAVLTRQLLAFSRRQMVERKVLSLNDVVQHSLRMLRRVIGEDVELHFLPKETAGNLLIDPGQAEEILVNLAVNARNAMPGGGRLTIETGTVTLDTDYCSRHPGAHPGCHVALLVSDSGNGMTEEEKAHVFEPFFSWKGAGTTTATGLGLATVFGIVKQNGGHIEVYSELGLGTTFKVYLPRVTAEAVPVAPTPPAKLPHGTETVFIVEDEDIVRGLAEKVLKRQGYKVQAFRTAAEALAALGAAAEAVHLLLTDVVLPGMNGRELAGMARALRPDIKVLYCSGYTRDVIAHHGVIEEGLEFIGKPYSALELAQRVRSVLDAGKA